MAEEPESGGTGLDKCKNLLKDTCGVCDLSEDSRYLAVKHVVHTQFLGANAVDAISKAKTTLGAGGKRTKTGGTGLGLRSGREEINLGLPTLSSSYNFLKGQQLGILKQALHNESRQRRAILSIQKKSIPQHVTEEDILKQLELLLKVDHINILAFHEACEDDTMIHLVYDWPDGGLLLNSLTQYHEDVTEEHVATMMREILSALAAANHFGVFHLDWSLLNLFLGRKGALTPIKLFGLGLGGTLVPLVSTRTFSRSNKHFYSAPELWTENLRSMPPPKRHSCDVWSCGTLLYMLCSGRPPFYGQFDDVVEKIKKGKWKFGYEFDVRSREAKDLIETMLVRKWNSRPAASQLLNHTWLQRETSKMRHEGVICQDALSKLNSFAHETHCKQTLARLLADIGLQDSQYTDLEEKFKQLDLDGNGVIEVQELVEIGHKLPDVDPDKIMNIIMTCDRNGNGTVDISEFVAGLVLELEQKDERLLVKAFEKMDINGDARITKGELFKVLRQYSGSLDPTEVSAFVSDTDKDKDAKIDFAEFKYLFPHMAEKGEEIKGRMRTILKDVQTQKKAFTKLKEDTDKFFRQLRGQAGKIAQECKKMTKGDSNEVTIRKEIDALHKMILEYIGKPIIKTGAGDDDVNKKKNSLTGLTVMHHNKKVEGGGIGADGLSRQGSMRSNTSQSSGGSPAGGSGDEKKIVASAAPGPDGEKKQNRPVAEAYVRRSLKMRRATLAEVSEEARVRRMELWQVPQEHEKKPSEGAEAEGHTAEKGPSRNSIYSSSQPWTTSKSKLRLAKEAMDFAGGPKIDTIGLLKENDQRQEIKQFEKQLFQEYHLSSDVTDELCDIAKLLQYKAIRTWIPPILLWKQELENSKDEQKVRVYDRRLIHINGCKWSLQLCERMLFSVTEFLAEQEEGLRAMSSLESNVEVPVASRRFLPHRVGEEDELARTPRDEDDADSLAPDTTRTGGSESGDDGKVTFADNMESGATSENLEHAKKAAHANKAKGLSRVTVRSGNTHAREPDAKLRSATESAFMTASIGMSITGASITGTGGNA